MIPRIVGITGFKRSGKDTLAGILRERAGFVRVAFADALKEEVRAFLGISGYDLERDKERWRPVLQYHGCAMREKDSDYWINRIAYKIAWLVPARVVITDVRFRNEAAWIRKHGGEIVRVVRDGAIDAEPSWHVSEREVAEIEASHVIDARTVEELSTKVGILLEEWGRDG